MGAAKGTKPWNAGTSQGWTDRRGYRWRYIYQNGKRRAIREQRFLMQEHIGRPLLPTELVHHKNGDTTDNCIENLEIQQWDEHTVAHSVGRTHPEASKRAAEVFANFREENRRLREANADLLAACKACERIFVKGDAAISDAEWQEIADLVFDAIARARGGQ